MRTDRPILLVDDDLIDTMTVQRAFRDLRVNAPLVIAENGEQAIRYLEEMPCKPGLILLDLNMPVMNGIEFLVHIKSDPELRCIPVVVLTTSREEEDKQECFSLNVAGYMSKPVGYPNFVELMRALDQYWTYSEAV